MSILNSLKINKDYDVLHAGARPAYLKMENVMIYHNYKFGLRGNVSVFLCKLFGHRLNEDPKYAWCERCGLCYEECYYPKNYAEESGIIDVKRFDEHGNYKCSECRERERQFFK